LWRPVSRLNDAVDLARLQLRVVQRALLLNFGHDTRERSAILLAYVLYEIVLTRSRRVSLLNSTSLTHIVSVGDHRVSIALQNIHIIGARAWTDVFAALLAL
jgi:hypothetical protein